MPALNIARYRHRRQRGAPSGLIGQKIGGNRDTGSAPDAQTPVIFLQPLPQGIGRLNLHRRIDGGADRQAATKKLILAKGPRQLPPDLISEIAARRQRLAERRIIAVLHRQQRLGQFFVGRGRVDIAVLHHLAQHIVAPFHRAVMVFDRMQLGRLLGQSGQIGRLSGCQIGERFVEIGLGGGSDTIGILAKEYFVQIKLQDLVLAQGLFDPGRKDQLLDLALSGPVARQQEILHHLLGDGRCPAQILPPRFHRLQGGCGHAPGIKSVMYIEILVLGRDKGLLDHIGNFLNRHKDAPLLREFVDDLTFARIDPADGRRGILRQPVGAGQIAAIHGENRADHQRREKGPQGHGAEQRSEDRCNEPDHQAPL